MELQSDELLRQNYSMNKSWKTTSGGIAAIAGGVTGFVFGYRNKTLTAELCMAYVSSILAGVGLLFGRDNNVSSVDVGIQGVTTNSKGDAVITPAGPNASDETKEKYGEPSVDLS